MAPQIAFWQGVQFLFARQWSALRREAADRGIRLIGDLPIYTAYDSADVWAAPDLFQLGLRPAPDGRRRCPPDAFSPTGQLWGNPLYNWEYLKATGYKWWIDRIAAAAKLYDVTRIDHFRGFDEYYAIPYPAKDAVIGDWLPGPGHGPVPRHPRKARGRADHRRGPRGSSPRRASSSRTPATRA